MKTWSTHVLSWICSPPEFNGKLRTVSKQSENLHSLGKQHETWLQKREKNKILNIEML